MQRFCIFSEDVTIIIKYVLYFYVKKYGTQIKKTNLHHEQIKLTGDVCQAFLPVYFMF